MGKRDGLSEGSPKTLPRLLLERCRRTPAKIAFRYKSKGIYNEVTWKEYYGMVEAVCLGLLELGLEPKDKVAILGDNCLEWALADMASLCAGAVGFGIYPTSSIPEVKYLLEDGEAKFLIADDQEYVDKGLSVIDQVPLLQKIIVADTRGIFMYKDPRLMTLGQVEELGKRRKERQPDLFEELISQVKIEDEAFFVYSSGTTGYPKGAVHTHYSLYTLVSSFVKSFKYLQTAGFTTVANMPYAHLAGRGLALYINLFTNGIIHYPEEPEALPETLYEVQPSFLTVAPRLLQKYAARALSEIKFSNVIKRACYGLAMKIGRYYAKKRWEKSLIPGYLKVLNWFARQIAFRGILDTLGFRKMQLMFVGGAPVPSEVVALWQIWGVNLLEFCGQTEGGFLCAQREAFSRPGNVGCPILDTQVRVSKEGELLAKSGSQFIGYWKNEKQTAETLVNGWVHTEDLVHITGEKLKIVDRLKDIIITAGGKNISPSEIETTLKSSPYISEVMVFGDGKKYPACLIEINYDTVSEWARDQSIVYTSFDSLARHPKVNELIGEEVKRENQKLARVEQVKKYRLIPKELDPEDEQDPLTPTRKIKRGKMYDKFKVLVDSMYSSQEEEEVMIRAEVGELE